jgi:hypothetical protein
MSGAIQYLSRSEFAAAQGWSPSYVTKLGKQGRLILADEGRRVDVAATLALLKRTEDPGKDAVKQHHAAARAEKHVGTHVRHDAPGEEGVVSASADPRYWDNKARREGALAELAELELAKKRGELVERARVEAAAFAVSRMLRDTVLGLPTQLAPEFAAMSDAFAIETRLRTALRQVFEDAARITADDLDRAMEQTH